jgi:hypothetical protein
VLVLYEYVEGAGVCQAAWQRAAGPARAGTLRSSGHLISLPLLSKDVMSSGRGRWAKAHCQVRVGGASTNQWWRGLKRWDAPRDRAIASLPASGSPSSKLLRKYMRELLVHSPLS